MAGVLSADIELEAFLARVPRTRALSERFLYSPTYELDEYDRESRYLLGLIRVDLLEHPAPPTAAPVAETSTNV